jgi:toxin-antitoxin system PIN domain toxin
MILLDVGVWLAAVWARHTQHRTVATWFEQQTESFALCRVTQMSLMRLLSNEAVMGPDVLPRLETWHIVDQLRADGRIRWADEPVHLEPVWRAISARDDKSHKLWTDDYLAAFAQAGDLSLATLDQQFEHRYPSVKIMPVT